MSELRVVDTTIQHAGVPADLRIWYTVEGELIVHSMLFDGIQVVYEGLWDSIIEEAELACFSDYVDVYKQNLEDKAVEAIEARLRAEEELWD